MVNRGTEEVLAYHPGIRRLWVYDYKAAKGGVLSSLFYHFRLFRELIRESYDTVIDFSHGDRAALLSFMTWARTRITYEDSSLLSRLLMNRIIRANPHEQHIVDYQLQVLRSYGIDHFDRRIRIHIPKQTLSSMSDLLSSLA